MELLPAITAICVAAVALHSCGNSPTETVAGRFDPENFATMTSTQVSTLISDSGITRYRIDTPLWLMFDQATEPRWTFPEGMHLEKYDDFFRIDATVDCDSATYFKNKQLWRLDGYVDITNMANEKFLTHQLFWDQKNQKIYSDSFIHIERADRIIEGYGFVSNDKMTQYHVVNVSGIFPVERDNNAENSQTSTAISPDDSVGTAPSPVPTVQGRPGLRPTTPRSSQRRRTTPIMAPTEEPPAAVKDMPPKTPRDSKPVKIKNLTPLKDVKPVPTQPSTPKRTPDRTRKQK